MIPADKWPEWADRLCWDEDGAEVGQFIGASIRCGVWYTDYEYTDIPIPPGHDWRVPVMRPTVKESLTVDLDGGGWDKRTPADYAIEHAGYLANAARRMIDASNALASTMQQRDDGHDLSCAIYEFEKCRARLLALIDGQKGVG